MNSTTETLKKGNAILPLIVYGDPSIEATEKIIEETEKGGADGIIIGFPFSDPTAEGVIIQEANIRALKAGATTDKIFESLKSLRERIKIPMAVRTYANVVFSYGAESYISKCRACAVDALIIPDLPFEEKGEFADVCEKYGVNLISQVTLASKSRVEKICREAEGFLYIETEEDKTEKLAVLKEEIRKYTNIPFVIGIESARNEHVSKIADLSDGVIIGCGVAELVSEYKNEAPHRVGEYIKGLKR